MVTSPWRERREVWREKRKVWIFGKGKCELIANCANFWQGKVWIHRHFSTTMVTSLPSISLSLSVSLSLSLSPKVPHAQCRKRFRASYNVTMYVWGVDIQQLVLPWTKQRTIMNSISHNITWSDCRINLMNFSAVTNFLASSSVVGSRFRGGVGLRIENPPGGLVLWAPQQGPEIWKRMHFWRPKSLNLMLFSCVWKHLCLHASVCINLSWCLCCQAGCTMWHNIMYSMFKYCYAFMLAEHGHDTVYL